MIRSIFSLLIIAVFVVLALFNREAVRINYLFGTTQDIPFYIILVGAFIAGGLAFTIFLLPAWIQDKMEIRKLKRSLQKDRDSIT